MTDEEMKEQQKGVVQDRKRNFRHNELENGNDPVKSGESVATDWAMQIATLPPESEEGGFEPTKAAADDLWVGSDDSVSENKPGQGRPKEGPKPGTQKSARGRDPLAKEERKRDSKLKNNIFNDMPRKTKSNLLNEENILDSDI